MSEHAKWNPPRWVVVTDVAELVVAVGFSLAYVFAVPIGGSLEVVLHDFGPAVIVFTLSQSLHVACHFLGQDDPRYRRLAFAAGVTGLSAIGLLVALLVMGM